MWGPRCEEHCIHHCRYSSCWFLKAAYCSASHDASCCANKMLITECVTSQPETCYPWLQKLIDIRSWTASENLFTQMQDLLSVFLSTNHLVRGHSCVSSHFVSSENPCCVSDRPRKHRRVCCHFKRLDFCLCELPRTVETAFSAAHCSDGSVSVIHVPILSFRTTFFCHLVQ